MTPTGEAVSEPVSLEERDASDTDTLLRELRTNRTFDYPRWMMAAAFRIEVDGKRLDGLAALREHLWTRNIQLQSSEAHAAALAEAIREMMANADGPGTVEKIGRAALAANQTPTGKGGDGVDLVPQDVFDEAERTHEAIIKATSPTPGSPLREAIAELASGSIPEAMPREQRERHDAAREMVRQWPEDTKQTPGSPSAGATLADCPIGLFMCGGELCLKTEYGDNTGHIDAFIVSSGEAFWGPQPQTVASQRATLVVPVDLDRVLAALAATPPPPERTGTGITDETVEAASRAVVAEWQAMIQEHCGRLSASDAARAFVSPGNYRLIRAALNAALRSANPTPPSPRKADYGALVEEANIAFHGIELWRRILERGSEPEQIQMGRVVRAILTALSVTDNPPAKEG